MSDVKEEWTEEDAENYVVAAGVLHQHFTCSLQNRCPLTAPPRRSERTTTKQRPDDIPGTKRHSPPPKADPSSIGAESNVDEES